jgi:hypothetical protein
MLLDLHPEAEREGRAASSALPARQRLRSSRLGGEVAADYRHNPKRLVCDFCGRPRSREERNRLVWENALAPGLVLAELCPRCAMRSELLRELHGGRGRNALRLVEETRAAASAPRTGQLRVLALSARGTLYLLIALASFLLVTIVTSHGR